MFEGGETLGVWTVSWVGWGSVMEFVVGQQGLELDAKI